MRPKDSEHTYLDEAFERLHNDVVAQFPHLHGDALIAAEMTILVESLKATYTELFGPIVAQHVIEIAIQHMQQRRGDGNG